MSYISVINIWKTYFLGDSEFYALKGVSLSIQENEFISVMGPSGSGKSTLMYILGCLDQPTKGKYILNGVEVQSMNKIELAKIRNKKIGFVFQGFNLLPRLTILENVELPLIYSNIPKKIRKEKAMYFLKLVGLDQKKSHYPHQLSGGQHQRVAIARALVNQPDLILADEPTGNLDSKTGLEIMEIFLKIHQEQRSTILMVTHEKNIASFAQRIIYFRDGKIV